MAIYLFATVIAFLFNLTLIVPFINFLYKLKFQRQHQETKDAFNKPTPIFDKFHQHKAGVPIGGGILVVLTTVFLFIFFILLFIVFDKHISTNYPSIMSEIKIILFTFIGFAFLGVYDDLSKIFVLEKKDFFGLRLRHKLIIEIILAGVISWWLIT